MYQLYPSRYCLYRALCTSQASALCISQHYAQVRRVLYVLVIPLQILPLQSIMHELDECFILGKCTVWRGIADSQMLYKRDMNNIHMGYQFITLLTWHLGWRGRGVMPHQTLIRIHTMWYKCGTNHIPLILSIITFNRPPAKAQPGADQLRPGPHQSQPRGTYAWSKTFKKFLGCTPQYLHEHTLFMHLHFHIHQKPHQCHNPSCLCLCPPVCIGALAHTFILHEEWFYVTSSNRLAFMLSIQMSRVS